MRTITSHLYYWRRHAEAFAQPRDTALPNDDDDIIRANTNLIGTMI